MVRSGDRSRHSGGARMAAISSLCSFPQECFSPFDQAEVVAASGKRLEAGEPQTGSEERESS